MSESEVTAFMEILNAGGTPYSMPAELTKSFLLLEFPKDKAIIARLKYDRIMEWYAHQFQKNPGAFPVELTSKEFTRFWKWRVVIPTKIFRLFYRIKNGEIFKHYQHITEMKKKVKPHSI